MQNLRLLEKTLSDLCDSEHYLFSSSDIASLFPELSKNSLKALLSSAAKAGIIKRVCRGIYLFDQVEYTKVYELFHAASRLRAWHFNYISLETALSDEGVISQMLINNSSVETWKLLVQTRPEQHLSAQRIHIYINSVPNSGLILKR